MEVVKLELSDVQSIRLVLCPRPAKQSEARRLYEQTLPF